MKDGATTHMKMNKIYFGGLDPPIKAMGLKKGQSDLMNSQI